MNLVKTFIFLTVEAALGNSSFIGWYTRRRKDGQLLVCETHTIQKGVWDVMGWLKAIKSDHGDELENVWIKSYYVPKESRLGGAIDRKSAFTVMGNVELSLNGVLEREIKEHLEKEGKKCLTKKT